MRSRLHSIVESLSEIITAVEDLEDMHVGFPLPRARSGAGRKVYLLRTLPTADFLQVTTAFDEKITQCVRAISGGVLPAHLMNKFTLPIYFNLLLFVLVLTPDLMLLLLHSCPLINSCRGSLCAFIHLHPCSMTTLFAHHTITGAHV